MKKIKTINSTTFYGNEVSDYAKEKGYVDYETLAKSFDHILSNEKVNELLGKNYELEIINGTEYDDEAECFKDIFQNFEISEQGAYILIEHTDELVYYCEELNVYIWAIDFFGTPWDCELTNIEIKL